MKSAFKHNLLRGCIVILFIFLSLDAKDKKCKKCCPPPPPVKPALIVGTWLLNEIISDVPAFSVLTAHQDGTLSIHRSLAIQQPVPADFPTGNFTTLEAGVWRALAPDTFKVLSSSVVNLITTGIPQALVGVAAFARAKTDLNIIISADNKKITLTGTIALFEADDLTFTKPILDPITGLPFVSQVVTSGRRLNFLPLDFGP